MSQDIEDFISAQEAQGLGTRQQILDHFRKSDDPDWKNYFASQSKANVEKKAETMLDMATTPHPVFGITPAELALYGAGGAAAAGAGWKLGQKAIDAIPGAVSGGINAIKNRWMSKPAADVSSTVAQQQPGFQPVPSSTEAPPKPLLSEAEMEMVQRSEANRLAKEAEATVKSISQQGQVTGSVQPTTPIQPAAIAPSATPPVTVTPPQPTISQAVATGQDPTKSIQAEIAQQIDATPAGSQPPKNKGGRPSKAAREAELAQGVFKEGFGGADNWLQSQVGHEIRRFIKDEFNAGKPYGSGQAALDKAYSDVGKYEQWLKENIPVQTLNKAERKALGVPSPAPYGPLGKAIKVGGTAGLLMSAVNAANAREAAQNVGEALLPIGMTPGTLEPGTLTEKQLRAFQEAQKLGSPYRSVPPPR